MHRPGGMTPVALQVKHQHGVKHQQGPESRESLNFPVPGAGTMCKAKQGEVFLQAHRESPEEQWQVWSLEENRGKGTKALQGPVSVLVWPCRVPDQHSLSSLLCKLYLQPFPPCSLRCHGRGDAPLCLLLLVSAQHSPWSHKPHIKVCLSESFNTPVPGTGEQQDELSVVSP